MIPPVVVAVIIANLTFTPPPAAPDHVQVLCVGGGGGGGWGYDGGGASGEVKAGTAHVTGPVDVAIGQGGAGSAGGFGEDGGASGFGDFISAPGGGGGHFCASGGSGGSAESGNGGANGSDAPGCNSNGQGQEFGQALADAANAGVQVAAGAAGAGRSGQADYPGGGGGGGVLVNDQGGFAGDGAGTDEGGKGGQGYGAGGGGGGGYNADNPAAGGDGGGGVCVVWYEAPCDIDHSNGQPGLDCQCDDGYAGNISWDGQRLSGNCVAAPCDIVHSNQHAGPDCQCMDGYAGQISWDGQRVSGNCVSTSNNALVVVGVIGFGLILISCLAFGFFRQRRKQWVTTDRGLSRPVIMDAEAPQTSGVGAPSAALSRMADSGEDGGFRSPIKGLFRNVVLLTISAALGPLLPEDERETVLRICEAKARELQAQCQNLTSDMIQAIVAYTMQLHPEDDSPYWACNKALRNRKREAVKPWVNYIHLLLTALSRLPPSPERKVFRGYAKAHTELGAQFKKGGTFVFSGFTSAATDLAGVQEFLGSSGPRTLVTLHLKKAPRSIRDFSMYPDEAEVVLPPGATFEVTSAFDAGHGLTMMDLKQVDSMEDILHFD